MAEQPSPLDLTKIRILAEDLGSPDAALQFLSDYLNLLPRRLKRVLTGLVEDDREVAMDAILSLKISSAMNGAGEAEACCRTLESQVRAGRFDLARREARTLVAYVSRLYDATPALLKQARADLGRPGSVEGCAESMAAWNMRIMPSLWPSGTRASKAALASS